MANTIGPPPTGQGWDESYPANTDVHGNACYEIRDLRMGLRIRMEKEHADMGTSSAGGEHLQGSAVAWCQAAAPTTRPDGVTDLDSDDLGRIWLDTTNNLLKMLTGVGTPDTWTPVGELAVAVYSPGNEPSRGLYAKGNELYWKGADSQEKFIAGLLDEDDMASDSATKVPSQQSVKAYIVSGTVTMANKTLTAPTLTSPVLNTGVSGTAVLDEDNMASDSATKVATQQSIKAYVDAQVAAKAWQYSGATVHADGMDNNNAWQVLDLSGEVGSNRALVLLEVTASADAWYAVKPTNFGSATFTDHLGIKAADLWPCGASCVACIADNYYYLLCMTDSSGQIHHGAANKNYTYTVKLIGFQP